MSEAKEPQKHSEINLEDFKGFDSPTWTQIPNQLLGNWDDDGYLIGQLANMSEAELKVVLIVLRFSIGFHRSAFRCSLNDMVKATGLSKQGVLNGAEAGEKRGLIARGQDGGITIWAPVIDGEIVIPSRVRGVNLRQRCPGCGKKFKRLEKHHKVPRSIGGDDSKKNKIELCTRCHGRVHILIDEMETPNEAGCLNALARVISGERWSIEWTTSVPKVSTPKTTTGQRSRPRSSKEKERKGKGGVSSTNPTADPFEVSLYFKDKDHVRAIGNWTNGPWEVKCLSCGEGVRIKELDTPAECLCGMHEYTLVKKKKHTAGKREVGPVEAYLTIAGRKKHTIAQEWLEEIEKTVTDLPFWRQVVKEWCGKGWNRGNVSTMLQYYEEGRLPGTRRKKEQDGPKVTEVDGVKTLVYEEDKNGPKEKEVDGRRVLVYE